MAEWREVIGLFILWLAFMAVVGISVARVGLLLYEQRLTERAYRLRLAATRGEVPREAAAQGPPPCRSGRPGPAGR